MTLCSATPARFDDESCRAAIARRLFSSARQFPWDARFQFCNCSSLISPIALAQDRAADFSVVDHAPGVGCAGAHFRGHEIIRSLANRSWPGEYWSLGCFGRKA